ncbi:MAG: prepilin peptidase, partial [Patescibacteria group bacterium]
MQGGFFLFALFMFGLAFGSFLNVVAFRFFEVRPCLGGVGPLRGLGGRSRCMKCGTQLRWFELIPLLSFVFLRGRCGTCKEKISWQYPVVELVSGLLFALVFFKSYEYTNQIRIYEWLNFSYVFAVFWIAVFLILLLMSVIDLRHYIIPDELNLGFLVLGFVGIFLKTLLSRFQQFFIG